MKRLLISSIFLLSVGCAGLIPRPCPIPCPIPTPPIPTPTPVPTPTPIPTPIPTPSPLCVSKHDITSTCHAGPSNYWNQVNQMLSFNTGCNINSDCPVENWQEVLINTMTSLNNAGLCATYDLAGSNPGSEMGVRGLSDNFTEYYQPITTARKIRWSDALSVCTPVWDSNTVDQVKEALQPPPSTSKCPVSVGGDYFVQIQISSIGGDPIRWTATAKYCGFPLRNDIFPNCGTKCCTLGVDGGNQAAIDCEISLSGVPIWSGSDSLQITVLDNPYNVRIDSGHGTLKACGISGCSNEVQF